MASRLMHERRQTPRVAKRVPVTIAGEQGVIQAETKNISAAGAYCSLEQRLAPMTKLELEFSLETNPKSVRVRCHGVVVRVEPLPGPSAHPRYDTAIFFTDLAERDRQAISEFVRQHLAANP